MRQRACGDLCGGTGADLFPTAMMSEQIISQATAMLGDTENYPFIGDTIEQLKIGHTAFHRYFPVDHIKQLRAGHSDMSSKRS